MLLPHLHVTKHEQPAVNRTPDISIQFIQKKDTWEKEKKKLGLMYNIPLQPESSLLLFPSISNA